MKAKITVIVLLLVGLITGCSGNTETNPRGFTIPSTIQDLGDKLAITDWGTGKILLLDKDLQEIDTYQVICEYNSMYVSLDAKKVYVFMPDQGLQITDLASGEMEVELEDTVNLFVSNECGNVITFAYTDLKTKFDECGTYDLSGRIF